MRDRQTGAEGASFTGLAKAALAATQGQSTTGWPSWMNAIVQVQRLAVAMELRTLREEGAVARLGAAKPKHLALSDPSSQSLRQVVCPAHVAHNETALFRWGTKEVNPWTLQAFDGTVRQMERSVHTARNEIARI